MALDEAYRLKQDRLERQRRRNERHKQNRLKGGPVFRLIKKLAFVAAFAYTAITVVTVQADNADKRRELEELKLKEQQLQAENEECARLLDDENEQEYYERLAIETQDYAYPSERRFIDTSRN